MINSEIDKARVKLCSVCGKDMIDHVSGGEFAGIHIGLYIEEAFYPPLFYREQFGIYAPLLVPDREEDEPGDVGSRLSVSICWECCLKSLRVSVPNQEAKGVNTSDGKVNIGDRVRDKITGFEGIAYGRWECITGCVSFDVHPRVKEDGKLPSSAWIDESRLEVVEAAAVTLVVKEVEPAGPCSLAAPTDGPR